MNINATSFAQSVTSFISNIIPEISDQNKKVGLVALLAFATITAAYFATRFLCPSLLGKKADVKKVEQKQVEEKKDVKPVPADEKKDVKPVPADEKKDVKPAPVEEKK